MKTILAVLSLLLVFSFTDKKTAVISDVDDETVSNIDTIKAKSNSFSTEDSLAFYKAVKNEEALIDQFCACATEKGRGHADCSDFIRQKRSHTKVQEKIYNKYIWGEYENKAVSAILSKEMQRLTDKFNNCGKK